MRDFVNELELRLHSAAEKEARRGLPARASRTITATPAPFGAAAVLAALALSFILISSPGGSANDAQAFPVLERPVISISSPQDRKALQDRGADLASTRTFATPHGPGYVAPAAGDQLCLAIPDINAKELAGTCQLTAVAKARGLVATLIGSPVAANGGGGSELVAVLPRNATARVTTRGGKGPSRPLVVRDGVVAEQFFEDVRVAITINGRTSVTPVPLAGYTGKGGLFDCGHGRPVVKATSRERACGSSGK